MAKHNKGRQIYLTRKDIQELASMVELCIMSCDDDLRLIESYQVYAKDEMVDHWAQEYEEYQERRKTLERLDKKLWYYGDEPSNG